MKTFLLLMLIGYIIFYILPVFKKKGRWSHIIEAEKNLRKEGGRENRKLANQFRELRKKAKKSKFIAAYLDSTEQELIDSKYRRTTAKIDRLNDQSWEISQLQRKVQELETKNLW